jgi:hypothetical protein
MPGQQRSFQAGTPLPFTMNNPSSLWLIRSPAIARLQALFFYWNLITGVMIMVKAPAHTTIDKE